jgi:guanine nucleotide-binding protein G(i) subunit alpha
MGACGSNESASRSKESEVIDKQLRDEAKKDAYTTRLLLLGTGESGKSTLAKQLRLLGKVPFTEDEREIYRDAIQSNIKRCAQLLAAIGPDASSKSVPKKAKKLLEQITDEFLDEKDWETISNLLQDIWSFPEIKSAIKRDAAFGVLPDSASYFFDALDRIGNPDYVPSDDDIIRVRVKTTGTSALARFVSPISFLLFCGLILPARFCLPRRNSRSHLMKFITPKVRDRYFEIRIVKFDCGPKVLAAVGASPCFSLPLGSRTDFAVSQPLSR